MFTIPFKKGLIFGTDFSINTKGMYSPVVRKDVTGVKYFKQRK